MVANCWKLMKIVVGKNEEWEDIFVAADAPDDSDSDVEMADMPKSPDSVSALSAGWEIMLEFAESNSMTFPQAESELESALGSEYRAEDWQLVLAAFMRKLEDDLMKAVKKLKERGCIHGDATLEEVLNPPFIKQEDADMEEIMFEDGEAGIDKIVSLVKCRQAIAKGEVIVIEDNNSSDDDEPIHPEVSNKEIIKMCEKLEYACLGKPDLACNLELTHNLHAFRAHA
ncbi:hypothetical protein C8J56DRAFT_1054145 [Mycena floridula]|nr:hypothetical protein C8J56DRAFT_1054145 [Mycena floridula]